MEKEIIKVVKNSGDEIIKVIQMHGEVLDEVTLSDLQNQTGDISKFDTLVLEIASPGGSVSEGLAIMVWLDKMSGSGKKIVTVVTANAYSIASLIMLVADIKLISNSGKVMVHNPMVPLLEYVNANDLQQYIDNLRSLEDTMYELYEFFTGLKKEQIKLLMDNETYLKPQQAIEYGFADMVVDIKPKSYEMTANNKNDINMSKTLNILNKVIGMVNKSEFINQIYSDLEGGEVEIFQADPSTYAVGDKTSMEEGEIVLADGSKLSIAEYKIVEINRSAEGEAESMDEEVEAAEFNEGPAPEEMIEDEVSSDKEMAEEVMEEEVPAMVEDDKMVVDAPGVVEAPVPSSVIETKKEVTMTKETIALATEEVAVVAEEVVEEAVAVEAVAVEEEVMMDEPKMEEKSEMMDEPKMEEEPEMMDEPKMEEEALEVTEDHMAEMHATIAALESRIEQLEGLILGYDAKFEALVKFENIATEAIDTLATNTVSTFKPAAKAVSTPTAPKGSIFNQLKNKRGL